MKPTYGLSGTLNAPDMKLSTGYSCIAGVNGLVTIIRAESTMAKKASVGIMQRHCRHFYVRRSFCPIFVRGNER